MLQRHVAASCRRRVACAAVETEASTSRPANSRSAPALVAPLITPLPRWASIGVVVVLVVQAPIAWWAEPVIVVGGLGGIASAPVMAPFIVRMIGREVAAVQPLQAPTEVVSRSAASRWGGRVALVVMVLGAVPVVGFVVSSLATGIWLADHLVMRAVRKRWPGEAERLAVAVPSRRCPAPLVRTHLVLAASVEVLERES
jgi:hypothetical protein